MLVADFLLERLEQLGLRHVFGVAGDYILPFFDRLVKSKKLQMVNGTDEGNAGFTADAYARANGVSCVVATYGVGALKLVNSVAGAFAERSPVIVISGAVGVKDRHLDYVQHHVVKGYDSQRKVFEEYTCAAVVLDDPTTAGHQLDHALEMLRVKKQPIYIELPIDVGERPIKYDFNVIKTAAPQNDQFNMKEAVGEIVPWLAEAKQPVILAGVQIARYNLEKCLIKFAERANIPVATTMLSKSTVNERHPLFLGTYAGAAGTEFVKKYVETSDCLLLFGEVLSDMTCGFKPPQFNRRMTVTASVEGLKVKNHAYGDVDFRSFCEYLFKSQVAPRSSPDLPPKPEPVAWVPEKRAITTVRFFEKVNSILDGKMALVADPGDSLFGAVDVMSVNKPNTFFGPAFYNSMGFAIPGALGVQLACPSLRPVVLVGDGAFQMSSCTELSTMARWGLNPIVFVLNNRGYTTERFIRDGSFNDIQDWNYERMTDVIGYGRGFKVTTEEELDRAVSEALASKELSLINVLVGQRDISPALRRMTAGLAGCISS